MSSAIPGFTPRSAPAAGQYRIDPEQTEVRFTARRLFGLLRVAGKVQLREATVVVGDPPNTSRMRAVLDASTFDTGSAKRDAGVRSAKYLDTATFADIVFTCKLIDKQNDNWVAVGALTAHGVTAPLDVTLDQFNDTMSGGVAFYASARVDRYAHGVTAGRGTAGRRLKVSITALGTRARHAVGQEHMSPHWGPE
jgi:polyisoprenoid-binding protein YceI